VDIERSFGGQPRALGPLLARVDVGRGQEAVFEDQMPELLRRLSENARIASITASNAIEGVTVAGGRAELIADGSRRFRNRNEREFAGYRDAIDELMRGPAEEPLAVPYVLHLHRQLFQYNGGRGGTLKCDPNLIVSYESGRREIVFEPTPPEQTEFQLRELLVRYEQAKRDRAAHPLLLIGGLIVDFLAIHPVADGNGRLARLLTTRELLLQGYGVTRYVSIEQRVYASKNAYYKALYDSQRGWHEGRHDLWPFAAYLVEVLSGAYDDFESQVAATSAPAGSKQERVRDYVLNQAPTEFRRRDVERALPGISDATIRLVMADLRQEGSIVSSGAGPGARWRRTAVADRLPASN
jgi:Fic family protein